MQHMGDAFGPSSVSCLVILIPTSAVGLIIGKAGLFLKYIGHISGAQLRLQSSEEMTQGMQERCVYITGDATAIKSALQVILVRLQVPSEPGRTFSGRTAISSNSADGFSDGASDQQVMIQWIIPQSSCGLLIGKNGSRIKMINEQSGAWVKIAHPEEMGRDVGESFIYIRGTAPQTELALNMVKRIAGGRPSKVKEPEAGACIVRIPFRAVNDVFFMDKANGVSIQSLFHAEGINVKLESDYCTGLSSAQLVFKGGLPERHKEVEAFVLGRLNAWESTKGAFNEQHLLNSSLQEGDEDEAGSMRDEEGNIDARARSEMCLLMVYATESAVLVSTNLPDGTNIFTDIMALYGVMLELLPENALSASFGSRSRVVALIGPLGSILHALVPIHAIFRSHSNSQIVTIAPQVSSGFYRDNELSRSGSGDKLTASMMGMGVGGSLGGMELRGGGGMGSMGSAASSHDRASKRIDQLTSTIQELVAAMKQTDMVTDPPFMKFLLAFDEFKTAYAAKNAASFSAMGSLGSMGKVGMSEGSHNLGVRETHRNPTQRSAYTYPQLGPTHQQPPAYPFSHLIREAHMVTNLPGEMNPSNPSGPNWAQPQLQPQPQQLTASSSKLSTQSGYPNPYQSGF